MTTTYTPPTKSFYTNTWENMVDHSRLQIPFVSTWKDGMHFSKGLTFANKEAVKRALIIYVANDNRTENIFNDCSLFINEKERSTLIPCPKINSSQWPSLSKLSKV